MDIKEISNRFQNMTIVSADEDLIRIRVSREDLAYIITSLVEEYHAQLSSLFATDDLQEQGVFDNDEKANEVLVEKCLLYPQPTTTWRLTSDAGIITTVGKQIAYKSGFVTQQEALSLIKII